MSHLQSLFLLKALKIVVCVLSHAHILHEVDKLESTQENARSLFFSFLGKEELSSTRVHEPLLSRPPFDFHWRPIQPLCLISKAFSLQMPKARKVKPEALWHHYAWLVPHPGTTRRGGHKQRYG